jgi:hypothetical protein
MGPFSIHRLHPFMNNQSAYGSLKYIQRIELAVIIPMEINPYTTSVNTTIPPFVLSVAAALAIISASACKFLSFSRHTS